MTSTDKNPIQQVAETTAAAAAEMVVGILSLPPEIFHNILAYLDPRDLGRLPRVCKAFRQFVEGNNPLCRDVYLRILDKPVSTAGIDFVQEVKDLLRLEQVVSADWLMPEDAENFTHLARRELPFVHRTITRLLKSIPPLEHTPEEFHSRLVNAETYHRSATCEYLARIIDEAPRSAFDERCNGAVEGYFNQSTIFTRLHRHPRRNYAYVSPKTVIRPLAQVSEEERERRQMSAHLHCLLGIPDLLREVTSGSSLKTMSLHERAYATACAKVYDIREYDRVETGWGPFYTLKVEGDEEPGLRVDWEKAEAIMIVLGTNLRAKGLAFFDAVEHVWGKRFGGCWEGSYIPWVPENVLAKLEDKKLEQEEEEDEEEREKRLELEDLARRDPYGVSGTWLRVVCFLDYTDFFHFNFHNHNDGEGQSADTPREPLSTGEAVRLLLMKVHVNKIEPAAPNSGDHEDWPVVHFEGKSRALDWSWDGNADSDLKGTVRMTKEGEVRWTTYSIYDGEERWKSEGFQLGGRKSARGVIGNWFDRDYNEHGPCGPTAFWKVSDHEYDSSSDEMGEMLNSLLPLLDNDNDSDDPDDEDHEEDSDGDGSDSDEDEDLDHELGEEDEAEEAELAEEIRDAFGGNMAFWGDTRHASESPPPLEPASGDEDERDASESPSWDEPERDENEVEEDDDAEKENQVNVRGGDGERSQSDSDAVGREDADIEPPTDEDSERGSEDMGWDEGDYHPYEDGYDPYEEELAQRYEINADYRRFNDMMAARFQIGMPNPDDDFLNHDTDGSEGGGEFEY